MNAAAQPPRRLARDRDGRSAGPVRLVHLGLGNFFRAHAAWYTEHSVDCADWGYAAFTGRSPAVADALVAQDALYTLLVRGTDGSVPEVISSLSAVHAADDLAAMCRYLSDPGVAVVTLTVTEAGYHRLPSGDLDMDAEGVAADIAALRADRSPGTLRTVPGRLVAGLLARRAAGAGGIAIVPNDNVPDNGVMAARVVGQFAAAIDETLPQWISERVSFVATMVDRITPHTTDADRAEVTRQLGVTDAETVPTEPFSEWVLAGDFPNGRPAWDGPGARFVDDVKPFEQRKLWLLNGAHSVLAYAGSIRGHRDVADAIADPVVARWVEEWWDAASTHLTLPADEVTAYRSALRERFANPAIRHQLAQIAADGSQKVPIRAVPVIEAGLRSGRVDPGAARLVAGWIAHLRGDGVPVTDVRADEVTALAQGPEASAVARVLAWLGLDDTGVTAEVRRLLAELDAMARS